MSGLQDSWPPLGAGLAKGRIISPLCDTPVTFAPVLGGFPRPDRGIFGLEIGGAPAAPSLTLILKTLDTMKTRSFFPLSLVLLSLAVLAGCRSDVVSGLDEPMASAPLSFEDAASKVGREMIWADGILFRSVVPERHLLPDNGPFDELYLIHPSDYPADTFRDGYRLISDARPGGTNYNGGRWHLNVLKPGIDAAKYADADAAGDLDPADFMSTDLYFECPLLPTK